VNILLLGGSGFIGSHLTDQMLASGHEVSIYHATGTNRQNIAHIESDIRIIEGDFNNGDFAAVLRGVDVVVHLINSTFPGSSLGNPAYDIQSNVISSIRLLDACRDAGISKLVFLSSGGTVYGIPQYAPIDELHPLNPISPYGISKLMIEKYLAMYHHHYGLDYTVLRLSNPYGSRQDPYRGQGVLAAWMHRLNHNKPIEIWGDGSVVRDYIYIKDAVRAIEIAATSQSQVKVFNVGSGAGHSLMQLKEKLEYATKKTMQVDFKALQKVDVPVNILNIDLIKTALEWQPEISIDEGISLMWEDMHE
jgi:UDP-glucose 4-epimerase